MWRRICLRDWPAQSVTWGTCDWIDIVQVLLWLCARDWNGIVFWTPLWVHPHCGLLITCSVAKRENARCNVRASKKPAASCNRRQICRPRELGCLWSHVCVVLAVVGAPPPRPPRLSWSPLFQVWWPGKITGLGGLHAESADTCYVLHLMFETWE